MLRGLIRAALTAILIPIASTFALAQAPATAGNSGYAAVNGLKFYYEIRGSGQPLALIHAVSRRDGARCSGSH
jgi:hypothetical protein